MLLMIVNFKRPKLHDLQLNLKHGISLIRGKQRRILDTRQIHVTDGKNDHHRRNQISEIRRLVSCLVFDDALDVHKMKVHPGGKQCLMHDTLWNANNV